MFFILTIIFVVLYSSWNYLKILWVALKVPGPFGHFMEFSKKDLLIIQLQRAKKFGPLLKIWFFSLPIFIISDPDCLQGILSSNKHNDKSFFYIFLHNFLGRGLLTNSGRKWATHRKYIQPLFHKNILEEFLGTFNDCAKILSEKLMKGSKELNVTGLINECVIDILNEAVLGVATLERENSPFREGKLTLLDRFARPWLFFSWIYDFTSIASNEISHKKKLENCIRKILKTRKNKDSKGRKSLLDYFVEISKVQLDFTEQDVIDEVCTFMLAGQDSVGASLAFSIYALAKHPDHQKKCFEEIDSIFQGNDRDPTMNDIKEMKYLEMCIKEAMRLYPAVPLIARRLGEDLKCGNYTLPSGAEVLIVPYIIHHLDNNYEDPEKFDPERFSQDNIEKRNPFTFLPFSGGPRKCIGYKFAMIEMKAILSKILRNFELQTVDGKLDMKPIFRITLRASGGVWVKLNERNK